MAFFYLRRANIVEQINYANARSQFSKVMERVLLGYAVKITRKEKDAVVLISEKHTLNIKMQCWSSIN